MNKKTLNFLEWMVDFVNFAAGEGLEFEGLKPPDEAICDYISDIDDPDIDVAELIKNKLKD